MQSYRFLAALLFIGLAMYLPPALRNGFVAFDDDKLITMNPVVQELSHRSIARAFSSYDPELYVPLTLLTYQIEHAIAGNSPALFHVTNVVLHVLSAVFLFVILRRLTSSEIAAAAGAMVFLLHPIQTEAVLWASARKDVLSGMFAVASLLAFLRWRDENSAIWYWLCISAFIAALLSKVTVALLPIVFLTIDSLRGRQFRDMIREHALFIVVSTLFIAVALLGKSSNVSGVPLMLFPLLAAKSFTMMLAHVLWPAGLNILYPQTSTDVWPLLGFVLTATALVAGGFLLARRSRNAAIGVVIVVVGFLPSIATFLKNGLLYYGSDRYAYVPMMGVALLVSALLAQATRRVQLAVAAIIIVVAAPLTLHQARTWHSTTSLFTRAVAMNPENALAHNNLGAGYLEDKQTDAARQQFEAAIALDAAYAQPHLNLALLHRQAGNSEEAMRSEEAAVFSIAEKPYLLPDDVNAHAVLAQTYLNRGRVDDALVVLADAARRAPDNAQAFYNLGMALYDERRPHEAAAALRRAVALAPRSVQSQYVLAAVLGEIGDLHGARAALRAVVRLAPGYELAEEHLRKIDEQLRGDIRAL